MALPKLFQRIFWHNNTTPDINEDNLNAMSKAIDDIDNRLITIASDTYEKIPEIEEDMEILGPAVENIDANVARAETAANNAETEALKSEGFAVGTQDGVEVTSGEYYQNNAKYYANIANPPIENTVDFTDIITISDAINKAAKDVRLKVEAVQDLHGYDKPWVGGAGKNKLPNTASSTTSGGLTITKNDDGSIHISGTRSSGGDYYYQINNVPVLKDTNNYILSGITGGSSTTYQMVVQDFVDNTNLGISYDGDRTFVATANGVKVFIVVRSGQTINKTFYPMIRLATVSDATYEPYKNICPISGWDNAKVTRSGKNRATFTADYIKTNNGGASSWNGNVKTVGNMTFTMLIDSDNKVVGVNFNGSHTQLVQFKMGTFTKVSSIKINGCPSGGSSSTYGLQIYDETASSWGATDYGDGIAVNNLDPSHIYSLNVYVRANISINNLVFRAMASVEGGDFEPYQGIETTISLNGTRYGGILDVTSGVLTLTQGYATFNGSEDWRFTNDGNYDRLRLTGTPLSGLKPPAHNNDVVHAISNQYIAINANQTYAHTKEGFATTTDGAYLYLYDSTVIGILTITEWKARLASNPLQIVYELATPQTIQLTPTQVYLLYGYNTLFGDCGDISLTYDASGIVHIDEVKLDTETLKTIAAASSDFADFKARIAAL